MEHILVVDDDADVREYLDDILTGAGYHVHEAANGSTVIDLLRHNPVDLVVTDIVMPVTDGIETIRDVKRLSPDIKIIATSGYDFYLEMAGKLGADWIFKKPFDVGRLLPAIRVLLRSRRADHHAGRSAHRHGEDTGAFYSVDAWQKMA